MYDCKVTRAGHLGMEQKLTQAALCGARPDFPPLHNIASNLNVDHGHGAVNYTTHGGALTMQNFYGLRKLFYRVVLRRKAILVNKYFFQRQN